MARAPLYQVGISVRARRREDLCQPSDVYAVGSFGSRAARRIKQGRQKPQSPCGCFVQRPLVGDEHDKDDGASFNSTVWFAQAATISPFVISQYGLSMRPPIPSAASTSFQ